MANLGDMGTYKCMEPYQRISCGYTWKTPMEGFRFVIDTQHFCEKAISDHILSHTCACGASIETESENDYPELARCII